MPNQQAFVWVVSMFASSKQCVPSQGLRQEGQVPLVLMRLHLDAHVHFSAELFKTKENAAPFNLFETVLTIPIAELKGLL